MNSQEFGYRYLFALRTCWIIIARITYCVVLLTFLLTSYFIHIRSFEVELIMCWKSYDVKDDKVIEAYSLLIDFHAQLTN